MYLVAVTFFLAIGGTVALAIRAIHLTPQPTAVTADTYNRLFTLHGVVMVWLLHDPFDPGGVRQLPAAAHDRAPGTWPSRA